MLLINPIFLLHSFLFIRIFKVYTFFFVHCMCAVLSCCRIYRCIEILYVSYLCMCVAPMLVFVESVLLNFTDLIKSFFLFFYILFVSGKLTHKEINSKFSHKKNTHTHKYLWNSFWKEIINLYELFLRWDLIFVFVVLCFEISIFMSIYIF